MTTNENLIPIPRRLHSVAIEHHVAGADKIYDDNRNKAQDEINQQIAEIGDKPYDPTEFTNGMPLWSNGEN